MLSKRTVAVLACVAVFASPASGADINSDGQIDADDALVMYYAFALKALLGDGEGGGVARFRRLLLGGRTGQPGGGGDDFLQGMLRRANVWSAVGVPVSTEALGTPLPPQQPASLNTTCAQLTRRYCGEPPHYPRTTSVPACSECVFLVRGDRAAMVQDFSGVYGHEMFDSVTSDRSSEEDYVMLGNARDAAVNASSIPEDDYPPSGYFVPDD